MKISTFVPVIAGLLAIIAISAMGEVEKSPSDCSKLDYDGFEFEKLFDCCEGVAAIEGQGPALIKADPSCFSTADLCATEDIESCCIGKVGEGKWDLACFALYSQKEDLLTELKAEVSGTLVESETATPATDSEADLVPTTGGAASIVSTAITTVAMAMILA